MNQLRSEIRGYFGAVSAFDERVAEKLKLSRTDLRCLELIERLGPLTAGQLSDESGLSTGAVTFLLDRLEDAGMVRRRRDTDDRRRVWVELVASAHKRILRMHEPMIEDMREMTRRFKADELAIVRDFMQEAKEVFERHLPGVVKGKKGHEKDREGSGGPVG